MISCVSVSAMFRPALVATALALACPLAGGAQAPVPTPPAPSAGPAGSRAAAAGPGPRARRQHHAGVRGLVPERRRHLHACWSATSTATPRKRSTSRSGPTTASSPAPVDQGQPTHFQTGRQWGVFAIKVPRDFGTKALTWTITSNGESQSIPLALNKNYPIEPFEEKGMGNKPPVFTFGGAHVHRPADGGRRHAHRHREAAGHAELRRRRPEADQEGLRVGVQPQRRRASPRCRSTSSAAPAR